jgi:hypothetical protein
MMYPLILSFISAHFINTEYQYVLELDVYMSVHVINNIQFTVPTLRVE